MSNVLFQSCLGCENCDRCAVQATYEAQCTEMFTRAKMPLVVEIRCEFYQPRYTLEVEK